MKLASVLVAAAFVGVSGYTIYTHLGLGGDFWPGGRGGHPAGQAAGGARAGAGGASVGSRNADHSGCYANRRPEPDSERAGDRAVAVPNDRASLARALQRELQRVGCYDGEINGNWSTSTRMAMKAFTDRVNASLPTDAPDYILLSLVQRHEGKACGTGCPTGQNLSDEGRCVPSAVLAKAAPTKPVGSGEAKAAERSGVSSGSSWAPTAGLAAAGAGAAILAAPEVRGSSTTSSARSTAGLPGPRPETGPIEPRDDRWRYSASRESKSREMAARADVNADPATRDRPSNQRTARAEDAPKPGVNATDEPPPRKVRKKYKQPKFVRQFLRSMKSAVAGMPF